MLRYPKEKEAITGINFEPWHFRYVGIENAMYMTEKNLTLEEYIAILKQNEALSNNNQYQLKQPKQTDGGIYGKKEKSGSKTTAISVR